MFKLIKKSGRARAGEFHTEHGIIKTPVFMNVGTQAAIKGGLSSLDLDMIGCQVELCNTYHLHLRPTSEVIRELGGLHKFMKWDKPILTDSGGFQVFSLASLRNITEEGVGFSSHIDGKKFFMTPELSMQIQSNLGSTIAMAFDECVANPAEKDYVAKSADMTVRWLNRCKDEMTRLNTLQDKKQLLFGINQGGTYLDIREDNMNKISELDLDGYAIGGLAVGEPAEVMYEVIDRVERFMPEDKPRYLMGVGTPDNILNAVKMGVDFFDCVMPARNARHGKLFTSAGEVNILNAKYALDKSPIDESCQCSTCTNFSRGYIRHLLKAKEILGLRLCVMHNLYYYNHMMVDIRNKILNDEL